MHDRQIRSTSTAFPPELPEGKKLVLVEAYGLLGGKIWPAASTLCQYLKEKIDNNNNNNNNNTTNYCCSSAGAVVAGNGIDCIELGSGTGAVGIYVAAAFGYRMTVTEYRPPSSSTTTTTTSSTTEAMGEEVNGSQSDSDDEDDNDNDDKCSTTITESVRSDRLLNLLQQNVDVNRHLFSTQKQLPRVCELDFCDVTTRKDVVAKSWRGRGYDLILASDVTYTPSLHQPLADTIAELLVVGTTSTDSCWKQPTCILSHQERLLNKWGKDYQLLQFEEALRIANLSIVERTLFQVYDDNQQIQKVSVLEIQRRTS